MDIVVDRVKQEERAQLALVQKENQKKLQLAREECRELNKQKKIYAKRLDLVEERLNQEKKSNLMSVAELQEQNIALLKAKIAHVKGEKERALVGGGGAGLNVSFDDAAIYGRAHVERVLGASRTNTLDVPASSMSLGGGVSPNGPTPYHPFVYPGQPRAGAVTGGVGVPGRISPVTTTQSPYLNVPGATRSVPASASLNQNNDAAFQPLRTRAATTNTAAGVSPNKDEVVRRAREKLEQLRMQKGSSHVVSEKDTDRDPFLNVSPVPGRIASNVASRGGTARKKSSGNNGKGGRSGPVTLKGRANALNNSYRL